MAPSPTGPTPGPAQISDPAAQAAALSALRAYLLDVRTHRFRSAWSRLADQERGRWGGFHAFRHGVAESDSVIVSMVAGEAAICPATSGIDVTGLDLSEAWLGVVTHGPVSDGLTDPWLVAPGPGGYLILARLP